MSRQLHVPREASLAIGEAYRRGAAETEAIDKKHRQLGGQAAALVEMSRQVLIVVEGALAERDARIRALVQRVAALEREM